MKFLGFENVLCLSPHPDDVEFGMSGTILKYNETNFGIICLSTGSSGDITSGLNRHKEIKAFWQNVPNVTLFFSDAAFISNKSEEDWLNYLEKTFLRTRVYNALFVPSADDSHYEHRIVFNLSFALVRTRTMGVVSYCTPSTLNSWSPNILVDISNQIPEKLSRLQAFNLQSQRAYFQKDALMAFHTNFQCFKKGGCIVEKFYMHECLF